MASFWDSAFQLVFGRRGPRPRTSAPPPPPPQAPPPVRTSPPPPTPPTAIEPAPPAPPPPIASETAPTVPEAPAPPPAPQPTPEPTLNEPANTPEATPAPVEQPTPAAKPDDFLTPHFQLVEFIRSETAQRENIDNMPPGDKLANIRVAAEGMEKVRTLLGDAAITISSGYRCPQLNHAIGGSPTSDHMEGFSVDFRCDGFGAPYDIVERLMGIPDLMERVDQLIFEKSRWVHISFAPQIRKQVLTAYEKPGEAKTYYAAGLKRLNGAHLEEA